MNGRLLTVLLGLGVLLGIVWLSTAAQASRTTACTGPEDFPTTVPCIWTGGEDGSGPWAYVNKYYVHIPIPHQP